MSSDRKRENLPEESFLMSFCVRRSAGLRYWESLSVKARNMDGGRIKSGDQGDFDR